MAELAQIEEEADTNVNNGLPLIKEFESLLKTSNKQSPFFLIQLSQKQINKKLEKITQYKIDLFLNQIQLFYNRVLISRA